MNENTFPKVVLLAVLVFASGAALADSGAPEEEWNKTFGSSRAEWAYSFQQTSDAAFFRFSIQPYSEDCHKIPLNIPRLAPPAGTS